MTIILVTMTKTEVPLGGEGEKEVEPPVPIRRAGTVTRGKLRQVRGVAKVVL